MAQDAAGVAFADQIPPSCCKAKASPSQTSAKPESDEPTPDERPDGQESRPAPAVADPSGKVQAFGELLDEVIDGGHRVLVFSQFTSMLRLLREELEERGVAHCYLDGSTADMADEPRRERM